MFKKGVMGLIGVSLILSLGNTAIAKSQVTVFFGATETVLPKVFPALEAAFEKEHPSLDVSFEFLPCGKYNEAIMLRGAIGTLPDVLGIKADYRLDNLVDAKLILPLDNLLREAKLDISNYPQNLFRNSSRGGKLYGLPATPHIRGTVNYNKDAWDAAGISYPSRATTWKEFRQMLVRLIKRDSSNKISRYGSFNKYPQYDLILLFGAKIVDNPLDPTTVLFGRDEYLQVIEEFLEMTETGEMMPLSMYKALDSSKPKIFCGEKAASILTHAGYLGGFSTAPFDWDIELIPAPDGIFHAACLDVYTWCINSKAEDPLAALEFARWLVLSPSALKILESQWTVNRNQIPYAPELRELFAEIASKRIPDNWSCLYEALDVGIPDSAFKNCQEFSQVFNMTAWDVLYGRAPVNSLRNAAEECQRILDELNIAK